nr:transcription repressor OFP17-like [Ipomoea batatas]
MINVAISLRFAGSYGRPGMIESRKGQLHHAEALSKVLSFILQIGHTSWVLIRAPTQEMQLSENGRSLLKGTIYKLNTDATVDSNNKCMDFGWVLRDGEGQFTAASSIPCKGVFNPKEAEAMAIREALRWTCTLLGPELEPKRHNLLLVGWLTLRCLERCAFGGETTMGALRCKVLMAGSVGVSHPPPPILGSSVALLLPLYALSKTLVKPYFASWGTMERLVNLYTVIVEEKNDAVLSHCFDPEDDFIVVKGRYNERDAPFPQTEPNCHIPCKSGGWLRAPYKGLTVKDIKKTQQQLKGKPTTFVLKQGSVPILRILLDKEEGTGDNFEMIKTLNNAYGGNNSAKDDPKIGGRGCDTPTLPANKTSHRKARTHQGFTPEGALARQGDTALRDSFSTAAFDDSPNLVVPIETDHVCGLQDVLAIEFPTFDNPLKELQNWKRKPIGISITQVHYHRASHSTAAAQGETARVAPAAHDVDLPHCSFFDAGFQPTTRKTTVSAVLLSLGGAFIPAYLASL